MSMDIRECKIKEDWYKPSQYEIDIFHIACEYMAKTELYDRSLIHKMHNSSAWVHPRYRRLSNLYAIKLRKEFIDKDVNWKDVRECIKQNHNKTADWWIEQWEMWRELEKDKNTIVSVEIKES